MSPASIKSAAGGDQVTNLDLTVPANSSATFEIAFPDPPDSRLAVELEVAADMVVPRTHAVIRHSGEELYFGRPGKDA